MKGIETSSPHVSKQLLLQPVEQVLELTGHDLGQCASKAKGLSEEEEGAAQGSTPIKRGCLSCLLRVEKVVLALHLIGCSVPTRESSFRSMICQGSLLIATSTCCLTCCLSLNHYLPFGKHLFNPRLSLTIFS